MDDLRILPYLHEYVETNYFTLCLALLAGSFLLAGRIPAVRRWSSRGFPLTGKAVVAALALFILLGGSLRAGWVTASHYRPAFAWSDAQAPRSQNLIEPDGINIFAAEITEGRWSHGPDGKPNARRPAGYPAFLGGAYALFGKSLAVLYALDMLLFGAAVVLVYLLAAAMFDRVTGLLAALLLAVYPVSVYSFCLALDEHLFVPLWYGGLYLLFLEAKGRPVRWAPLWYALIFGYSTMTRTHTIFMPLVVGYVYFLAKKQWKKTAAVVLFVLVAGQVLNLPWAIRNYRHWGVFVPYTATNHDVYHGCNLSIERGDNNGHWPQPGEPGYNKELADAIGRYDVPTMQRLARNEVVGYILGHPGHFAVLGIEKWLHFMGTTRKTGIWVIDLMEESKHYTPGLKIPEKVRHVYEELAFGAYYAALYLFLFGVIRLARTWRSVDPLKRRCLLTVGACFFLYLGEHLILYPERKYRFPLEPFMLIVASSFLVFLLKGPPFPSFRKKPGAPA